MTCHRLQKKTHLTLHNSALFVCLFILYIECASPLAAGAVVVVVVLWMWWWW